MNLDSYEQPNILFLSGCFLEDCNTIEDLFDEKIINESLQDARIYEINSIVYDKIPQTFTTVEEWPKKTNLKCWSCDRNFNTMPIFIPLTLIQSDDPKKRCGAMDPLGNFCTWGCAAQYINLYFPSEKWEKHSFLRMLYKMVTKEHIDEIVAAPLKTEMHQYGGKLTSKKYSELLVDLNSAYKTAIQHNSIDNLQVKN